MIPFVGVDGEGGDLTRDGFTSHEYTMLRVGENYVTDNWLPFLASQPKKQINVAFFFDYDVTMMLRDLPEQQLLALVDGYPITVGAFQLSYRPRKELQIKFPGRITTINDVGTFFQCRFVTALERWNIGTPEEREMIGGGKEQRGGFGELTPEIVEYNRLECMKLAELMETFRRTCTAIGYIPRRWQGPGQLAKAMFRAQGIPETRRLPEPPIGVWEMAQAAYYGGRFECSSIGPVKGPIVAWDINSAYPYACLSLPCLVHGTWTSAKDVSPFGMYSVTFQHRKDGLWYGLPVRTRDGAITFPRAGAGWYWGVELEAARKLGATFKVHHGWRVAWDCNCRPFDFMHRLYSVRKAVGKTQAGNALKLAMNSAYGITAQSVGMAPYANPVWAGLITAITRARLVDAVAVDPYRVHMLATDGLFASPGLELEESDALGGWERTVYPAGMHIVQPGVYFTGHKETCTNPNHCSCLPKTRGVPLSAIRTNEQALKLAWRGDRSDGLNLTLRNFIGLRLGAARGAWDTIGTWQDAPKRIGYDWSTKRHPEITRTSPYGTRTVPHEGSTDTWTVPYDQTIGGNLARNMERLEWADTPDWSELVGEFL